MAPVMSVPFSVRWQIHLLEPLVDAAGEGEDDVLVDRRQSLDLDRGELDSVLTDLLERAHGVLQEPPPESFVRRQLPDDCFHAFVRHGRAYCESRAACVAV